MSIDTNTINELEEKLYDLAAHWRTKPNATTKARIVEQYHRIYKQMIQLGWDQSLDIDTYLPDEVMPQEFHDLLKRKRP